MEDIISIADFHEHVYLSHYATFGGARPDLLVLKFHDKLPYLLVENKKTLSNDQRMNKILNRRWKIKVLQDIQETQAQNLSVCRF